MVTLKVVPHIEKAGYHLDRFDAYVNEQKIATSRQPLFDGARELLKLGYAADEMMQAERNGHIQFRASIGENAKYTIAERDRGGLRKEEWLPHPEA